MFVPSPAPFQDPSSRDPGHCRARAFLQHPPPLPRSLLGGLGGSQRRCGEEGAAGLRLALAGVRLMMGKLRASPFFADMISSFLCPLGFHLWPQSPFIPYSQAPRGPLALMGATVLPHLMQDGRRSQATVLGLEAGP